MKNKKISLTLAFIIVILNFCTAIVAAKYATTTPVLVDTLNLTIGTPYGYVPGEEYEPLKNTGNVSGYHVVYVCYNGKKNVVAKEEIYQNFTDVITIGGEIKNQDNAYFGGNYGRFLGWSLNGIVSKQQGNMVSLYNENRATIASLMANHGILRLLATESMIDFGVLDFYGKGDDDKGVKPEYMFEQATGTGMESEAFSSGEPTANEEEQSNHIYIFLYDIYEESPTLTVKPHSTETFASSSDFVMFEPHVWFLEDLMTQAHHDEDNPSSSGSSSGSGSSSDITIDIDLDIGSGFGSGYSHIPYSKGTYMYYTEQMARESATDENGELNQTEYEEAMESVGWGYYILRERYKLTSSTDQVDFLAHQGLYVSSGGRASSGSYVGASGTDVDFYLALFDSYDAVIDITSNDEDIMINRSRGIEIKADSQNILYAADTIPSGYTPKDDGVVSIACFTTGTLITLADGSTIPVEKLTNEHILRVFDHEKGCYAYAPPLLINYDGDKLYTIARLQFADGEKLEIINERGLFDITLNRYVYITPDNCTEFIGHRFAKEQSVGVTGVELVSAYKTVEYTGCYSVTSTYYINHFINGYLTVPGSIHWFVNYFEYGASLKYDQTSMAEDLAKYGEFTLEEILTYLPNDLISKFTKEELYLMFNKLYPAKYLKVTVGKGLASINDIVTIINDWIIYYDLSGKLENIMLNA